MNDVQRCQKCCSGSKKNTQPVVAPLSIVQPAYLQQHREMTRSSNVQVPDVHHVEPTGSTQQWPAATPAGDWQNHGPLPGNRMIARPQGWQNHGPVPDSSMIAHSQGWQNREQALGDNMIVHSQGWQNHGQAPGSNMIAHPQGWQNHGQAPGSNMMAHPQGWPAVAGQSVMQSGLQMTPKRSRATSKRANKRLRQQTRSLTFTS